MILTCPSCKARYTIDSAKLGREGRRVRCASCGHVWHQQPVDAAAQPLPSSAVASDSDEMGAGNQTEPVAERPSGWESDRASAPPVSRSPDTRSPDDVLASVRRSSSSQAPSGVSNPDRPARRGGFAAVLLWLLVLGSIAIAGLYLGRDHVVEAWPPAYRAYQELGIDVARPSAAAPGLVVRRVASERLDEEGASPPRLVVTGELVNDSAHVRSTPRLMATLFDDADRALFDWTFGVERERLEPGESIRFATALDNPDVTATRLEITVAGN